MAPHSSTLAWKIPWTEEPGMLQSMRSLRVGHHWATSLSLFTFIHWRRKWQPTPVFLPRESQGWGSLVGCHLWGRTVRHDWGDLAYIYIYICFSSVQSLSGVQLFATPWIAACQASLSITISRSSLRLAFIESVMLSSHLFFGRPLLLLPPIPPSIKVFGGRIE